MRDTARHRGPQDCLEENPTAQSVKLGDCYINIRRLADRGFEHGYLSRILSGERTPSLDYARRIANELGMTLESLLWHIDQRRAEVTTRPKRKRRAA